MEADLSRCVPSLSSWRSAPSARPQWSPLGDPGVSPVQKEAHIEEAENAIREIIGQIEDLSLEVDHVGADTQDANKDVEQLSKKIGALATEINNMDHELGTKKEAREAAHAYFKKQDKAERIGSQVLSTLSKRAAHRR